MGGLILLAVISVAVVFAQSDVPVGPDASNLGVVDYKLRKNNKEMVVSFSHRESNKDGELRIKDLGENEGMLLEFSREGDILSISWNPEQGEFTLQDTNGQTAYFFFENQGWVSGTDESTTVLEKYQDDVKLIGAIFSDVDSKPPSSIATSDQSTDICTSPDSIAASDICCGGPQGFGECFRTTRSAACECATSNAGTDCWNNLCIGCCRWVGDCDCACLIEDYFCACGRHGYSCSPCP